MAKRASEQDVATLRHIHELWWMGALQGCFALFFGLTALVWPHLSLITLDYIFSAFVLAVGIVEIVQAVMSIGRRRSWWATMLSGLITFGVGVYLIRHPTVSFGTFILLVGIILIIRGAMDVLRVFTYTARVTHKALSVIVGLAAIAAGIITLAQPARAGLAFVWALGVYGIIYGATTLAVSLEVRSELQRLINESSDI